MQAQGLEQQWRVAAERDDVGIGPQALAAAEAQAGNPSTRQFQAGDGGGKSSA